MKHRYLRILSTVILGAALVSGCATNVTNENLMTQEAAAGPETETVALTASSSYDDYFSNRDISGEIDFENAVKINLDDCGALTDIDGVTNSDSTVTITKEGTYILSGTLDDGSIIVNTSKEEKVQIVLNDVSITSKTFAPIYVVQADKVFITLAEGTSNTLVNGGSFTLIDDNNVDAVIFSKDDITLNGTGTLKITSPAGEGITGKDDVTITGGKYEITSAKSGIRANDCLAIADGIFDITADEGLEATIVMIYDGTFDIEASDDGINAAKKSSNYEPKIEINGGDITIVMGSGDTDGIDSNGDIVINGGNINITCNSPFDFDGEGTLNGGSVIANGEEITTLPNQMMGGHGGMRGQNDFMTQQKDGMWGPRPDGDMREPKDGMRGHNGGMDRPDRDINKQGKGVEHEEEKESNSGML